MHIQQVQPHSHILNTEQENAFLYIASDIHFDSKKCDRASLKAHLQTAKDRNGYIFIIGDLFDVMGAHMDPRSKPADIRPEYIDAERSYLDLVIDDACDFFAPHADNIALVSYGNHETEVMKRRDTDPILRFVNRLNDRTGSRIQVGAYQGFVSIRLRRKTSNSCATYIMAYHHGKGGNAKRSKGVLHSQIDAMLYSNANLIVSGHDHNKIYDPSNIVYYVTQKGRVAEIKRKWLKLGTYKQTNIAHGWEVQKGFMPSCIGSWFVDLAYERFTWNENSKQKEIVYISDKVTEAEAVMSVGRLGLG